MLKSLSPSTILEVGKSFMDPLSLKKLGKLGFFFFLFCLWNLPQPEGLSLQAWHLFVIFVGTISGIMTQIYPMGVIAIFAVCTCTLTQTLTTQQTLSAFSSPIGWLVFSAFLLARGFVKTGLGTRIAYILIRTFGRSTLGLSYSLVFAEFLLAPFTPSNTARGAGILFPVISALSKGLSSDPKNGTERRVGSFLMILGYQTNVITCALFLTASAANPLLVQLSEKMGIHMNWTFWAKASAVPGLMSLLILPLFLFFIFPPELKKTPEAPEFARQKLIEMGPISRGETLVLSTFLVLLTLWIFGPNWGIDATSVSLFGLSILLLTGVLTMDDLLKETNAWHTFLWMSTLIMICQSLSNTGLIQWFGNHLGSSIQGYSWPLTLSMLVFINFFVHYIFASTTAHISALYSMLASVAIVAGTPPTLAVLALSFSSNLCACITHFGTTPGPVYFSQGYVTVKDWWKVGFKIGIVHLMNWGVVGLSWWKFLGLW